MKKIYLSLLLIASTHALAMEKITLPSSEEISSRLTSLGLYDFVMKSKIGQTLGSKQLYPAGVIMAVETALYDYNQYNKNLIIAAQMRMFQPMIIETILQDHPAAIDRLKKDGLLK